MTAHAQAILKAFAALFFALLTAASAALSDGVIYPPEGIQIAIGVTTAAGVFIAANYPDYPYAKTAIAAVLTGLNFAITIITDGITLAEWVNLGLAVMGVFAVYFIPNRDSTPAP